MIAEQIQADHGAGRELLALVGNSVQYGPEERGIPLERLLDLWRAHGAMMRDAVSPLLPDAPTAEIGALQGQVEALCGALLTAQAADAPGWRTDHVRLRDLFDRQCLLESAEITPRLLALPAARIAEASALAGQLRGPGAVAG
ncbi:hypothetical protein [Rhodospirillum centenum]|uniref:Transcription activator, putative n=1 Tax=Rhodospirillum centenum (strain ATCC 51521 / SW) TaxID=414684 RepID=B6IRL9_RHOCS|nr:hypothetical protein [Rhodospirillum centenum]ACI98105.1 transcription activator, putative [Rhodospirillum centenum SW]